jgi:hypothetical protein
VILLIASAKPSDAPSGDAGLDEDVPPPTPDNDLEQTLRNAAAVGLFLLLAFTIVTSIVAPYFDRSPDTTLILGLVGSILGAMLMLLGIQTVINRRDR